MSVCALHKAATDGRLPARWPSPAGGTFLPGIRKGLAGLRRIGRVQVAQHGVLVDRAGLLCVRARPQPAHARARSVGGPEHTGGMDKFTQGTEGPARGEVTGPHRGAADAAPGSGGAP